VHKEIQNILEDDEQRHGGQVAGERSTFVLGWLEGHGEESVERVRFHSQSFGSLG
jgi:hypothetical protein